METKDNEVKLAEEGTIMARFQKERTDAISEMFDNVDKIGIYPTGRFFVRLDKALEKALNEQKKEMLEELSKDDEIPFSDKVYELLGKPTEQLDKK